MSCRVLRCLSFVLSKTRPCFYPRRPAHLAPEHARTKPFGQASSQLIPQASPSRSLAPSFRARFSCLRGSTDGRCDLKELLEGRSPTKVGDEPCTAPRSAPTACSPHVPHAHGSPRGPRALGGDPALRRRTCMAPPCGPATCAKRASCDLPLPMAMYGRATHGHWAHMMGHGHMLRRYGHDVASS